MKKRIFISLFLLVLFSIVSVFAQKYEKEKPNLSGTWEIEKSEGLTNGLMLSKKNSDNIKIFHQVIVEQKDIEIKISESTHIEVKNPKTGETIVEKSDYAATYFADARGETNDIDGSLTKSVTKWKGNVLTIYYYDSKKNLIGTVEWKLSKDGNNLIGIKQRKNFNGDSGIDLLIASITNSKTTFSRK
jgi:hypothetical protein